MKSTNISTGLKCKKKGDLEVLVIPMNKLLHIITFPVYKVAFCSNLLKSGVFGNDPFN